jgi:glycosyltransferase involved in cell wall biosynthesis
VAAFAELRRSRPHATLTIAGEGPLLAELAGPGRAPGLDDAVDFPASCRPTSCWRTPTLAQLSWWENCSYSLLDALVAGVGVCASPVGGNPEILPPECLVVPDDAERVAAVIAAQAEVGRRPSLASTWPTVSEMTRSIGGVYEGLPRPRRRGVAR